jgi:hypothetical protein
VGLLRLGSRSPREPATRLACVTSTASRLPSQPEHSDFVSLDELQVYYTVCSLSFLAFLPRSRRELEPAHANGTLFGYFCSTGTLPLLDMLIDEWRQ